MNSLRYIKFLLLILACFILSGCGKTDKEIFEEEIYERNLHHIAHEHTMECLIGNKHFIVKPEGMSKCVDGSSTYYFDKNLLGIYRVEDGLVEVVSAFPHEYIWGYWAINWLFRAVESKDYMLDRFNNGWRLRHIAIEDNKNSVYKFEILLDSEYRPMSANFEQFDGTVINVSILRFDDELEINIPSILYERDIYASAVYN